MAETFLLASKQSEYLCVKQLHINLWFLSRSKAFFDIGLQMSIEKELISQTKSFNICCHPLFSPKKGSLQELYDDLTDEETLQIVFNDEVQSTANHGSILSPRDARLICFKSGRKFLMLKPFLEENNSNKIKIEIDLEKIDRETIKDIFGEEDIDTYIRFRYMVNFTKTSNIFFDKRILSNQIHFDFRFNEPRLFKDSAYSYKELIHTKNIFLFMIQPAYYRSRLQHDLRMKYIRLLEKEKWIKYIKEIGSEKENFLVYYWKANDLNAPPNNEFNMLVSFEAEKVDFSKQLLTALILISIAYLSLRFSQSVELDQLSEKVSTLVRSATNIITSIIFALGIGITTNAVYDYIKVRVFNFLRNR